MKDRSAVAAAGGLVRSWVAGNPIQDLTKPIVGEQMADAEGKIYLKKQRTNRGVAGYKVGKDDPSRYVVMDPDTEKPDPKPVITSSRTPRRKK